MQPKIQWSSQQLSEINRTSGGGFKAPETTYDFSLGESLIAQTTTGAYGQRLAFEKEAADREVDVSFYNGVDFNRDNIRSKLKEKGIAPNIIDAVMKSDVNSWREVELRTEYLQDYYEKQQRVFDDLGYWGGMAATVGANVLDPTFVGLTSATLGVGAGASAIAGGTRIATLAARLGRIAPVMQYGAAGATEAILDNYLYEAATGVHEDGSYLNSALLGMALGGTLGMFVDTGSQRNLSRIVDSDGRVVDNTAAKEIRLANAQTANEELRAVSRELSELNLEGRVDQSGAPIRSSDATITAIEDAARNIEEITNARTANKAAIDNATERLVREESALAQATDRIEATKATRVAAENVGLRTQSISTAIDVRRTYPDGLPTKKAFVESRVGNAVGNEASVLRKAAEKEYTVFKKALKENPESISRLEARLQIAQQELKELQAKIDPSIPENADELLNNSQARVNRTREDADALTKADKDLEIQADAANKQLEEASKVFGERIVNLTDGPVKIADILKKHDLELSPAGIRRLADKSNVTKADLERMLNGEFNNLSDNYGVSVERTDFVTDLAREMDSVVEKGTENIKQNALTKMLPESLRGGMISPVSRLYESVDDGVRGLISKIYPAPTHKGKANNFTAWNNKRLLDAHQDRAMRKVRESYRNALADDSFVGTFEEWQQLTGREALSSVGAMQKQALAGKNGGEMWELVMAEAEANMSTAKRLYSQNANKHIRESVDSVLDYFEYVHKTGKDAGMDAFVNSLSKGYYHRIYSGEAINRVGREQAIDTLVNAQENFARATNKPWGVEEANDAFAAAVAAVDSALDPAGLVREITESTGIGARASTSTLKQRGIQAFDDDIAELLETNVDAVTSVYGMKTHGRIGLHQSLGVSSDSELSQLIASVGARGEDAANLQVVFDTVKGVRELDKNPLSVQSKVIKAASSYSTLAHLMGFGLTAFTETAAIAGEFGMKRAFNGMWGTPAEVYRLYKNGTTKDKNLMELMVNYGDATFSNRTVRFTSDTGFDSVGKVQNFLDKSIHKASVYGGLVPITDMTRMATASSAVSFLADMSIAARRSKADVKRLLDMGFTEADMPRIRDILQVGDDGRINNMNRASWGKLDEEISRSVQQMVDRVILEPNGATLPKIMTDMGAGGILPRIIFKFMRFPLASYEHMLYRGMQEMDAKRALGVAANAGMWSMLLSMKDAMREDDKKIYAGDAGMKSLVKDAFMYTTFVGGIPTIMDTTFGLATGKQLFSDYSYNMGGVVVRDVQNALTGDPTVTVYGKKFNLGDGVSAAFKSLDDVIQSIP